MCFLLVCRSLRTFQNESSPRAALIDSERLASKTALSLAQTCLQFMISTDAMRSRINQDGLAVDNRCSDIPHAIFSRDLV